jgi:hypothetical protein
MDVQASRGLAATLVGWSTQADAVSSLVSEAEVLADLPTGVVSMLAQVGGDGSVMAAAIRRAADALEAFTINLGSSGELAAVSAGLIKMHEVDRLTAAMQGAPAPEINELDRQRHELLVALGGVDTFRFAIDEGISLVDATVLAAEARALGMAIDEYTTYRGFIEHFGDFDAASGGDADEVVSIADLAFVVNNPESFGVETVASAAAMIAAPALRNRLDTARDRGGIVGRENFGATRPDDYKVSLADLQMFHAKQSVNFILQDLYAVIDVAAQRGDPSLADDELREEDFRAVLAQADELGLGEEEVKAVELVLDADWYDQGFWQEHGDSVLLATAVVAGAAIFVGTGGVGGGVSAALISTAYATAGGAALGAGATVIESLATGDPFDEGVTENTLLGATGGLAGAGVAGFVGGAAPGSLTVRVVDTLGLTADMTGLAADGLFDPLLTHVLDDIELQNLHENTQTASYLTGGMSLAAAVTASLGARVVADTLTEAVPPTNYLNYGGDTFDDGLAGAASRLPDGALSPAATAAAETAAVAQSLDAHAADLGRWAAIQGPQRVLGLGLDEAARDTPGDRGASRGAD